jgi:hypothetical protein
MPASFASLTANSHASAAFGSSGLVVVPSGLTLLTDISIPYLGAPDKSSGYMRLLMWGTNSLLFNWRYGDIRSFN